MGPPKLMHKKGKRVFQQNRPTADGRSFLLTRSRLKFSLNLDWIRPVLSELRAPLQCARAMVRAAEA